MDKQNEIESLGLTPTQIAWVVKDAEISKTFFKEMFGVSNFSPTGTTRLQDYDGTYYGQPADAENLVAMAYSGETFIEIIQPISGKSIFRDTWITTRLVEYSTLHTAHRLPTLTK